MCWGHLGVIARNEVDMNQGFPKVLWEEHAVAGMVKLNLTQARNLRAYWADETLGRKAKTEVGVGWVALEFSVLKDPLENSKR